MEKPQPLLNHLGHLAAECRKKGGITEQWIVLRNVYFCGEDPIAEIKKWADSEGLHASFNYRVYSPADSIVDSVTFLPKKITGTWSAPIRSGRRFTTFRCPEKLGIEIVRFSFC